MGLLQEVADPIGSDNLKRLSAGKGDFDDETSADNESLQDMIKNVDPQQLQQIFNKTAQQMDPEEYSDHITPGAARANELSFGQLLPKPQFFLAYFIGHHGSKILRLE